MKDRSGLQAGLSSTRTVIKHAECSLALSCWNKQGCPWQRRLIHSMNCVYWQWSFPLTCRDFSMFSESFDDIIDGGFLAITHWETLFFSWIFAHAVSQWNFQWRLELAEDALFILSYDTFHYSHLLPCPCSSSFEVCCCHKISIYLQKSMKLTSYISYIVYVRFSFEFNIKRLVHFHILFSEQATFWNRGFRHWLIEFGWQIPNHHTFPTSC